MKCDCGLGWEDLATDNESETALLSVTQPGLRDIVFDPKTDQEHGEAHRSLDLH